MIRFPLGICVVFVLIFGVFGKNDLNIPAPLEIAEENPEVYKAYHFFVKSLIKNGDLKASPCDDFYNYTCQNANVAEWWTGIDRENTDFLIRGLRKHRDARWYQPMKREFDSCVHRLRTPNAMHRNGDVLRKIFNEIFEEFGPIFPLFDNPNSSLKKINSEFLGDFVGYLAQKFEIHTFLEFKLEYGRVLIQKSKLAFPEVYFTKYFGEFEKEYKQSMRDYLIQLNETFGQKLNDSKLEKSINDVIEFEKTLAEILSHESMEDQGENYIGQPKNTGFINLQAYFDRITKNIRQDSSFTSNTLKITIEAPRKIDEIQRFLAESSPEVMLNYLHIRLARSLRKYFPRKPVESLADRWLREGKGVTKTGVIPHIPLEDEYPDSTDVERYCANALGRFYVYNNAMDRVFLDEKLPDTKERREFVKRIKIMINRIITGFRFQLDQISWLSSKAMGSAFKKLEEMLFNAVYDDWIENDDIMNNRSRPWFHDDIDVDEDEFTAYQHLLELSQQAKWKEFLANDRNANFSGSVRIVNAWYKPWINRFFIPLGLLQRPIFDINYPAAVQYGGIGAVIGHEIAHGFDAKGINYDDQGEKRPWMDTESKRKFNEMVQCVIGEYTGLHGKGKDTGFEDLADNAGLRAAWNAYKSEQALCGRNPQLPSSPFNKFTADQLFFLAFSHHWCSNSPKRYFEYEGHSPPLYRVWGSIQNFPAFRAAFNCPSGSAYAPKEHCDVWAGEIVT
ncbi:unnamed protein product [Bursaphelenchus xylophilus]|uniref:(pine wood nematode) hypothetical protein n=1 Tax=Bursaphelenchus xylophilus TaxID=6326 RepID=A0A1I7SAU6_BURXY|nr:unnamed protein product [Bursaphelenchus xylophilus]CAG9126756.1 unnamed protein product [Bursaphelenchus xylophilus]